jgi:hypothetical protein
MKKLLFLFLISGVLFTSCKKESQRNDGSSALDYIEATINGKTYKEEFPPANFSFGDNNGCDGLNKPYRIQNIGQIDIAAFFLDPYLRVYENNEDFKDAQSKSVAVNPVSSFLDEEIRGCNLDLEISLDDKSYPQMFDQDTELIKEESSGNITSVTKISESSTEVEYRVIGNFSCKFKNKDGIIIPVTGKFQTTVDGNK